MDSKIKKIIYDIKSLKIQGARNIAKSALDAIAIQIKYSKAKTAANFYSEISKSAQFISTSRPTEPMMRNNLDLLLRFAMDQIKIRKVASLTDLRNMLLAKKQDLIKKMNEDIEKIAEYGAQLIPDGARVITHCHSSSVTRILKKAKKIGKKFEVVVCETRPFYQGRVTATELVKAGIKTTFIVDGAINLFMKNAHLCLVGADAVTSRGDLINKVGTSTVAHIARMHDVSFCSAAELLKYSPETMHGKREKIEERNTKEIWSKPPKKLVIRNPAFDVTAAHYITGFITESGTIPSSSFFTVASQKLGIKI